MTEIGAPLIRRIEHAQLAMPRGGEEKARAFYIGVLGLPEAPKPAKLAQRGGCWFEAGPVKLHLGVDNDFRAAKRAHVVLVVEDLDGLLRKARDVGCEVVDPAPFQTWRQAYVFDLFGNRLELLEAI
jgi:catechol 2,3-dioxygenase-like lactoylglutathione lyase family enzyme